MRELDAAAERATRPIHHARQAATDYETGGASEGEEEVAASIPPHPGNVTQAHEDPIDSFLRKQKDNAVPAPATPPIPPAPPSPPPLRIPPRGLW
jgi:hypothetical protein